jgi:hypothetical protein
MIRATVKIAGPGDTLILNNCRFRLPIVRFLSLFRATTFSMFTSYGIEMRQVRHVKL